MNILAVIGRIGAFFKSCEKRIICIMLSLALVLQFKSVLRRIGQKRTFSVNIARIAQIAT